MKKRLIALMCAMMLLVSFPIFAEDASEEDAVEAVADIWTLTMEEAQQLAIENSYAISNLNRRIEDTKDLLSNQRDLQSTMSDLLKLPLQFIPSDITNDYVNALMIKNGYGVKGAQVQLTVLENTKAQTEEALKISATSAYYNVLLAKKAMVLQQHLYENAKGHLRTANVRFENGVITRLELLQAEIAVNSALTDLHNAEDDLNIERLAFNNTIGLGLGETVVLTSEIEEKAELEMQLEEAIEQALENRPEIENKRAEYELKAIEVGAITSYYTPNLRQHKFAVEELAEAEHDYQQTYRDIEMDVRNKYLDLVKTERSLDNMDETIKLLEEALRVTKLLYQYDMATLQEVSDAEVNLTQAQIGKTQMTIGYQLTRMMYENAIGVGMPAMGR